MWKQILETKIIRVEGLDQFDLITSIYISDVLTKELSPYNQDSSFELPTKVTCRIQISSNTSKVSKSVSFNTKILEEDGVQWLPLFENPDSDYMKSIPDEVISPRVLILLHKKISLDVITENAEKSEIGSACEEDYMPEIKLCQSFADSYVISPFDDAFEQRSQSVFEQHTQEVTEINNVRELAFNISDEINIELKNTVQRLSSLLDIEKKSKENVLKDIENIKNRYLNELAESKKRENEILHEFKEAESRYNETKFELTKLKLEIKSLQTENSRLSQTLQDNQTLYLNNISELTQKLQVFEENQSESEKILFRLSGIAGANTEIFDKLKEKDNIIKNLHKEIHELKTINNSMQASKQNTNIDELEETIQKYLITLKIPGTLIRDKEQIYIYGSKKVSILLKDGQLLCRFGGVFKPFDEYMHSLQLSDSSSSLSPHKLSRSSLEIHKEAEETVKIKQQVNRKNTKSLTIGSKSIKRGNTFN
jgi:hypothetical protein